MNTYYFEITPKIETWEVEAGAILRVCSFPSYSTKIMRLQSYSERVWMQEDNGRINILKDRYTGEQVFDVTDEESLKEFMWIKLKAKGVLGYA